MKTPDAANLYSEEGAGHFPPDDSPAATALPPRIIFTPWQETDGQWHSQDPEIVEEPRKIEVEPGWVHVAVYDSLGGRSLYRSYPSRVVESILWMGQ